MRTKAYLIDRFYQTWKSLVVLSEDYAAEYSRTLDLEIIQFNAPLKKEIDNIIFVHGNHEIRVIEEVLSKCENSKRVIIHLYGAPQTICREFFKIRHLLSKHIVKFVVGSSSNKKIMDTILKDPEDCFYYPYAPKLSQKHKIESSQRKKIISYWGRISWYKNVHQLIKLFTRFQEIHSDFELRIAGPIDNLNWRQYPEAFYSNYAGEIFFMELQRAQEDNINVKYYGNLEGKDLENFISETDIFTSLSTCEEEDFGLSILEALSNEIPVVATSWGGHKEFESISSVSLLKVHHQNSNLSIDENHFFSMLVQASNQKVNHTQVDEFIRRRNQYHIVDLFQGTTTFKGFNKNFIKYVMDNNTTDFFNQDLEIVQPMWE